MTPDVIADLLKLARIVALYRDTLETIADGPGIAAAQARGALEKARKIGGHD